MNFINKLFSINTKKEKIVEFPKESTLEKETPVKTQSFLNWNHKLSLALPKFNKQPKKKGSKTETYNVIKDGNTIGQIKWYSRVRGYAFLPTTDSSNEIKEFIKDLMVKRNLEKK